MFATARVHLRTAFLAVAVVLCCSRPGMAQDAWQGPPPPRFQVLPGLTSQAVLDRETAIVWERTPSGGAFTQTTAHSRCNTLVVSGRMGWRLPTIQELTSVLSVGAPNNFEIGHPFNTINGWVGQAIWSATNSASAPVNGWVLNPNGTAFTLSKGALAHCWCVHLNHGTESQ